MPTWFGLANAQRTAVDIVTIKVDKRLRSGQTGGARVKFELGN